MLDLTPQARSWSAEGALVFNCQIEFVKLLVLLNRQLNKIGPRCYFVGF